jgi:hypothetical protein
MPIRKLRTKWLNTLYKVIHSVKGHATSQIWECVMENLTPLTNQVHGLNFAWLYSDCTKTDLSLGGWVLLGVEEEKGCSVIHQSGCKTRHKASMKLAGNIISQRLLCEMSPQTPLHMVSICEQWCPSGIFLCSLVTWDTWLLQHFHFMTAPNPT